MYNIEITSNTRDDGEYIERYTLNNREMVDTAIALSLDELGEDIYTSLVITVVKVQS